MNSLGELLASIDVIRYVLIIIIITLTIIIVWILLREVRLWYWKANRTVKALGNIEKRMKKLENNLGDIASNIENISDNTSVFKHVVIKVTEENENEDKIESESDVNA